MSIITDLDLATSGLDSRPIINTNFDNLNTDKAELSGAIYTGDITFNGTTFYGVKLNSLTTAQRDALAPANGLLIYNSTANQTQFYENGAWVGLSGSADASVTVKGVVEEATEAEMVAGTAAGGTSARLFINPSILSDKILTALERTLVRGIEGTTDATEINQLAGTTNIAEADTFFGATDITGAQAETLTNTSNADTLHVHNYNKKLLVDGSSTTITGTTAQTDIFSVSIPGGTLGTDNAIEVTVYFNPLTPGAGQNHNYRFYYGTTSLVSFTRDVSLNRMYVKFTLMANGATGSQRGTAFAHAFLDGEQSGATSVYHIGVETGTSAEDSTGDLDLEMRVTPSDGSSTLTVVGLTVQLITA